MLVGFLKESSKVMRKLLVAIKEEEKVTPLAYLIHSIVSDHGSAPSANFSNNTWTIYTGASHHMTSEFGQLKKLLPFSQSITSTVNHSILSMIAEGSIVLSDRFTLDIVLVVLSL